MTAVQTAAQPVVPLDGSARLPAAVVGNKGCGIDDMCRLGLPVPPAFCLTTAVGERFLARPDRTLDTVWDEVLANLHRLEERTGCTFGCGPRPLLVSVRGGAARSMPGMLATALNIGVTVEVLAALATTYGTAMADDTADRFRRNYAAVCGSSAPADPIAQLRGAVAAVFASWNTPRARAYRHHHRLDAPDGPVGLSGSSGPSGASGTAVVVQAMVFGNSGPGAGSGVLFSRHPVTGAAEVFGEWVPGQQGIDLVSGTSNGQPLSVLARQQPVIHRQLVDTAQRLDGLAGSAVNVEFTVESGRLWILQSRTAVDAVQDTTGETESGSTATVLTTVLATGVPASPGVASGRAYADVDAALDAADRGADVILVRSTTSPDDVPGMLAARGVVTEIGGATSHAAVISREIGRPAVVGCGPGLVETLDGRLITIDGAAGEVRTAGA